MDAFDFRDENQPRRSRPARQSNSGLVLNILTLLVLILTACVAIVYLNILIDPHSALNPFQPPTLPPTYSVPSATPTSRNELPPTWTPAPTQEPTSTSTPRPTSTPPASPTPINLEPSITPTDGPTPVYSFAVQEGSPQAIPNIYHPELGCNWMGVAGQAVGLNGGPATGLIVQVGGSLGGQLFETRLSLTGAAPQYGQGGFEIQLAEKAVDSNETLWIQLVDQASNPFSDKIYFVTYSDCQKNLVVIHFKQVK
jgi:hypothetical protein